MILCWCTIALMPTHNNIAAIAKPAAVQLARRMNHKLTIDLVELHHLLRIEKILRHDIVPDRRPLGAGARPMASG
jgi:hypothetical protein